MTNAGQPLSSHWDKVYTTQGDAGGAPAPYSWYAPRLTRSVAHIGALTAGDPSARIFDAGTGESTLADDLLERGQRCLTLLDLSATALDHLRQRLLARHGEQACASITWQVGDVTQVNLPEAGFDLWHDRAVLHFLTRPGQRDAYVAQAARAVRPGGHLVVAAFAPGGPLQCSGLPVVQYDAEALARLFSSAFHAVAAEQEAHVTPSGAVQPFQYFVGCRR